MDVETQRTVILSISLPHRGGDFMFPPEIVTFTTNGTNETVTISAVADMVVENTETFTLQLSAPVDVTVGEPTTISIMDKTIESRSTLSVSTV